MVLITGLWVRMYRLAQMTSRGRWYNPSWHFSYLLYRLVFLLCLSEINFITLCWALGQCCEEFEGAEYEGKIVKIQKYKKRGNTPLGSLEWQRKTQIKYFLFHCHIFWINIMSTYLTNLIEFVDGRTRTPLPLGQCLLSPVMSFFMLALKRLVGGRNFWMKLWEGNFQKKHKFLAVFKKGH